MQTPHALILAVLLAGCGAEVETGSETPVQVRLAAAAEAPHAAAEAADTMATVSRRLLADPQVDWLISPSPDGREIARTEWWRGDLVVRDLATGQERHLTEQAEPYADGFAMFPRYSPDGRTIAYAWWHADRPLEWDLRVIAAEGGEPRALVEDVWYVQAEAWTPDGTELAALLSREDGTNDIVMLNVEDGTQRLLKSLDWRYPNRMDVSPDGRWIAYDFPPEEERDTERDIYVLAADGSTERTAVQSPADDQLLGWAPDGSLLFLSDRRGTPGAWLLPMEDGRPAGEPVLVKPDMWRVAPVGFLPDGTYFYGVQTGTRSIQTVSLDLEAGRVAGEPSPAAGAGLGSESQPRWSPDGRYLAYFVTPTSPAIGAARHRVIAVRSLESGEVRELRAPPEMVYPGRLAWTPDGSLLASGRDRTNRWTFYRVDPLTNRSERVLRLPRGENGWTAVLTPDGSSVILATERPTDDSDAGGTENVLLMREISTGEARVLRRTAREDNLYQQSLAVSPDGRTLAFIEQGPALHQRLILLDLETGAERELLRPTEDNIGGTTWTPDGRALLVATAERQDQPPAEIPAEPQNRLALIDVETGELRELGLRMEMRVLDLHPDGRRLAFVDGRQSTEIWALQNFLPQKPPAASAR